MPETKFETTFCRPKPMPTESAPATMARLERLSPAAETAASAATREADVADPGQHGVAAAGVEPGARQHRAAEQRLQ